MSTGSKIAPASQNTRFNFKSLGKTFSRTKARVYFLLSLKVLLNVSMKNIIDFIIYFQKYLWSNFVN